MLKDGMWRGRRCFILGGGESLKSEPLHLLRHELTIGVNMGFLLDPVLTLVGDVELMDVLAADPRWKEYKGLKAWVNTLGAERMGRFPGAFELSPSLDGNTGAFWWTRSLKEGIHHRRNTGATALHLADILGADPVYLLGFDMEGKDGRTANWHHEYKGSQPEHVYDQFMLDFTENVPYIRAHVVNLNPKSRLRCFPFATLREVVGCRG